MALVTITMTVGATCDYLFLPQASESLTGSGVSSPEAVSGYLFLGAPLSVQLDASYKWDVSLSFRNASPLSFQGFQPGAGGDLLTLMAAQGYSP